MKKLAGLFIFMMCFSMAANAKVYEYTQGNRLTLLEDPEASADFKVELIRNAKHHVHILTFFWDDSSLPERLALELKAANARGVEVRVLATFAATIGTDFFGKGRKNLTPSSDATFTYLQLTPGKSFSVTHSLHEKIFLVDGEKAIVGGRNVSDSSMSGKDMEVLMEGPVVNQVQDHFKRMFDFVADLKIKKKYRKMKFGLNDRNYFPSQEALVNGEEARILSHEAIIHHYENGMNRKERLAQPDDILDTVTKIEFNTLRAYNYFMIPVERYRVYLEKNLDAGKKIEMITNSLESAKFSNNSGYLYALPDARELVNRGLDLYQWQRNQKLNYVHEKVLIFDEERVIIGSHNFGTGSTSVSNEIAVEIKSKAMAARLIEIFDEEKSNEKITQKTDVSFLDAEIQKYKTMIKFLRTKIVGSLLREIY